MQGRCANGRLASKRHRPSTLCGSLRAPGGGDTIRVFRRKESRLMDRFESVTQLEIDQRVFDLYDEYCHGGIDRREFLKRASLIAGGLAMAQALFPRYAE